jgi:group I intron endonuclease
MKAKSETLEKKKIIAGTYRIKNLVNNKVYNGSSYNIYSRLKSHKKELLKGIHGNKHLQASFNKHGQENFVFETIEEVAIIWDWKIWTKKEKEAFLKPQILFWEQKHLDEDESWKSEKGYNICLLAGSPLGVKRTHEQNENNRRAQNNEKTKLKNSISNSGINNGMYGRKHSEEAKKKISKAITKVQTGRPLSSRHKKALSESKKGDKNPMFGKNIRDFMTEAAYTTMNKRIGDALRGKRKTDEHKRKLSESKKRFYMRTVIYEWS